MARPGGPTPADFDDEIAVTSGKTLQEKKNIALAFGSNQDLNVLIDCMGNVKAYRIGKYDASKLPGVKQFTGELLAKRIEVCSTCSAQEDYEYMGATLTTCRLAELPDCHRCHSEIQNNKRPCPRNILPIE